MPFRSECPGVFKGGVTSVHLTWHATVLNLCLLNLCHLQIKKVSLKTKLTLVEICSSRNKASPPSLVFFWQLTPAYCWLVICCWLFWRGQWCSSSSSHSLLFTMQVFLLLVVQLRHTRENRSLQNINDCGKSKWDSSWMKHNVLSGISANFGWQGDLAVQVTSTE